MSAEATQSVLATGTVKWFDCRKGFGFILDSDGADVFVHYTVIEGDGFRRLDDDEPVEFEVTRTPRGLSAVRVRRIAKPAVVEGSPE